MSKPSEARGEKRLPVSLAVRIEEDAVGGWSERTYTDNVNSGGARVLSVRAWKAGEQLRLTTRHHHFRTTARVIYCQPLNGSGSFAVGLRFTGPQGEWVIAAPAAQPWQRP